MIPMADLEATLKRMKAILADLGIRYHCTGGLVSSFYGEPRFTQDVDIVVQLPGNEAQVQHLISALQEGFVVDADLARRALGKGDMFQALDRSTWIKIDFHVGEGVPGELSRSVSREILPGLELPTVSREDAILSKILWVKKGSEKSRRDALSMLRAGKSLDWRSMEALAERMEIGDLLGEMRNMI